MTNPGMPGTPPPPANGSRPRGLGSLAWVAAVVLIAVLAAVVAVVATRSDEPGPEADGTATPLTTANTTTTPPSVPSGPPRPLGTFIEKGPGDTCLPGADRCIDFDIECPDLREVADGDIDVRISTGVNRGVVVLFTGASGGDWWLGDGQTLLVDFVDDLRREGLTIVQVRWKRGSWLAAAPGEDAGTSVVACRPATVVRWVHDNIYAPLELDPEPMRCGFCITGNSGGASQVSYALAYYGLDTILDAVLPTGGPPHAAQARGCLGEPAEEEYWYHEESIVHVDESYGFLGPDAEGPCARADAGFTSRWQAESVDSGGNDYLHPSTRLHFIFGGEDTSGSPEHGGDYVAALQAAGSPSVTVEVVPDMGHGLSGKGLPLLMAALLA